MARNQIIMHVIWLLLCKTASWCSPVGSWGHCLGLGCWHIHGKPDEDPCAPSVSHRGGHMHCLKVHRRGCGLTCLPCWPVNVSKVKFIAYNYWQIILMVCFYINSVGLGSNVCILEASIKACIIKTNECITDLFRSIMSWIWMTSYSLRVNFIGQFFTSITGDVLTVHQSTHTV